MLVGWACEGKGKGRRKNMLFGGALPDFKDIRQGHYRSARVPRMATASNNNNNNNNNNRKYQMIGRYHKWQLTAVSRGDRQRHGATK